MENQILDCVYPQNPNEAVEQLSRLGERAVILAGGTSLMRSVRPEVDTLIDLTRIGQADIRQDAAGWHVGCNVRLHQLVKHEGIIGLANSVLADAALSVGSRPIRNAVTVGGNLIGIYRWSDPPVALLALDAQVSLLGPDGERRLAVEDLLAQHPKKTLKPAEILLDVFIPKHEDTSGAFIKFARTAVDYTIVDAAVCLQGRGAACDWARIVVGGTRGRPFRVPEAEEMLVKGPINEQTITSAAAVAQHTSQTLGIVSDVRTDASYRQEMVGVIVHRAIIKALGSL